MVIRHIHRYVCLNRYVCIHIYMYIRIYLSVCLSACLSVYLFIYIYVHMYTYMGPCRISIINSMNPMFLGSPLFQTYQSQCAASVRPTVPKLTLKSPRDSQHSYLYLPLHLHLYLYPLKGALSIFPSSTKISAQ